MYLVVHSVVYLVVYSVVHMVVHLVTLARLVACQWRELGRLPPRPLWHRLAAVLGWELSPFYM